MCGRYSIYESMDHYLKELAPKQLIINGYDLWPIERYNVAPTTRVEIIRPVEDGISFSECHWHIHMLFPPVTVDLLLPLYEFCRVLSPYPKR